MGYVQYAPARFFLAAREYPAGPVSADAVLIAYLFIPFEEYRPAFADPPEEVIRLVEEHLGKCPGRGGPGSAAG